MKFDATAFVVSIAGLSKHYGPRRVLHDIQLSVSIGERLVVCGPSGSGKSTLARCISGLEPYDGGSVRVNGVRMSPEMPHGDFLRANIGMVFQQFNLFPHMSALDNCTLAQRWARGRSAAEAREVAMTYLEKVGLADRSDAYPSELSGGQQQRVAIARALCLNPSVMLFDEATSALDPETVKDVLDTMVLLARDGMTMVCITHEMGFARSVADTMVFMEAGQIVTEAPPAQFFGPGADPRIRRFLTQMP